MALKRRRRPGAYITFKSKKADGIQIGQRGTTLMPLVVSWGKDEEFAEITADDLLSGRYKEKVGDIDVLPLELALSGCEKVLVYKFNKGSKATATVGETLTVTAKYGGIYGNEIAVGIKSGVVTTEINGKVLDEQKVEDLDDLIDNDWVSFSGSGTLKDSALIQLDGGTNSTTITSYDEFFSNATNEVWQVLACTDTKINDKVKMYIKNLREVQRIKVQAVLLDESANYEGIIKIKEQKLMLGDLEVKPELLTCYVAGITAGARFNQSNTGKVTPFTKIVKPFLKEEIEEYLGSGFFIFTYNGLRNVCCEQDINSLTDLGGDKNYEFTKNRVIRTIDEIHDSLKVNFELHFKGQVNNNAFGRANMKGVFVDYFNKLEDEGGIENFSPGNLEIEKSGTDSVIVQISELMIVDSIEYLDMEVLLG